MESINVVIDDEELGTKGELLQMTPLKKTLILLRLQESPLLALS